MGMRLTSLVPFVCRLAILQKLSSGSSGLGAMLLHKRLPIALTLLGLNPLILLLRVLSFTLWVRMIKPFIDLALLAVFTLRATKPSGQINQTPARGVVKPTLCSIDFGSVQHQDLRDSLAPDAFANLDLIPPVMSLRGWAVLPPTWTSWIRLLVDLPASPPPPAIFLRPGCWNEVFTDGSCLHQSCPLFRCAAWSVTVAPPFHASWTPGGASVVCASYLPGVCQTAYRAELYAVGYALHCAAESGAPIRIWTDCLGVLNKFYLLVWGYKKLNVNSDNSDLWSWILQSVDRLGKQFILMKKVPAHRHLSSATTRRQAWMFVHNDFADRAARLASQARPPSFWQFWEAHVWAVFTSAAIFEQVRSLHLAAGRRQVQSNVNFTGEPDAAPVRQTRSFDAFFGLGETVDKPLPVTTRLFGTALTQRLHRWFHARLTDDHAGTLVWVSITQLYLYFQMTWGHPGPLRINNQWVDIDQRRYLAAEAFPFRLRVRWFRQFLKQYWKESKTTVALEQCRPASRVLQAFLPAASVPWHTMALNEIDLWLSQQLAQPCVRSAMALKNLPVAPLRNSMVIWLGQRCPGSPSMRCLAPDWAGIWPENMAENMVVRNVAFIFPFIGKNNPNWLLCFRGFETTNQQNVSFNKLQQ